LQTFVVSERPIAEEATQVSVRHIGDRFVVVSADAAYEVQNSQKVMIKLQNSLAFGSGLHPATILSLRLIEKYLENYHRSTNQPIYALDLGSGSGILTVAMAKLGIEVLAIDNDPIAVAATEDAIARNQVSDMVTASCASLGTASQLGHWLGSDRPASTKAIAATGQFDLIVANIFARVHISLAAEFYQALKSPSAATNSPRLLITAGYTSDRADDVIAAMQSAGFELSDRQQIDEWTAIAFQK
jgi:ribosomal protein L11 methyltransferase